MSKNKGFTAGELRIYAKGNHEIIAALAAELLARKFGRRAAGQPWTSTRLDKMAAKRAVDLAFGRNLTTARAAKLVPGVSTSTLYRALVSGKIKAFRTPGGHFRVDAQAVKDFFSGR